MQTVRYTRLYADEQGESHFEEIEVQLAPVDFAPPAPPLLIGQLFPAMRCSFVVGPPDWGGQVAHPAPRRQVFCTLSGEYEVSASDGTIRRFPTGSVLLLEDTTGKGHATRITSDDDAVVFAVALAD